MNLRPAFALLFVLGFGAHAAAQGGLRTEDRLVSGTIVVATIRNDTARNLAGTFVVELETDAGKGKLTVAIRVMLPALQSAKIAIDLASITDGADPVGWIQGTITDGADPIPQ